MMTQDEAFISKNAKNKIKTYRNNAFYFDIELT